MDHYLYLSLRPLPLPAIVSVCLECETSRFNSLFSQESHWMVLSNSFFLSPHLTHRVAKKKGEGSMIMLLTTILNSSYINNINNNSETILNQCYNILFPPSQSVLFSPLQSLSCSVLGISDLSLVFPFHLHHFVSLFLSSSCCEPPLLSTAPFSSPLYPFYRV